jgi:hypothetical protein
VRLITADAEEAAQVAKVQEQEAALIAATAGGLPPGATKPDTAGFRFEVQQLTKLRAANAPLRLKLQSLQFERAQAVRRAAYWQAFNPIETRGAWCADLTENAPAGSYVATLDIPGESNLLLIAPGARGWTPSDGVLTAREIMSPAQAFLNAAILPGVQKFRPTYRWGTITAISYATNRCSVSLAPAVSSAQGLGVNLVSSLTNVPVVYSTCNAGAFLVGDRVVVEFQGQSWSAPKVIGFLDNPKPCFTWPAIPVRMSFRRVVTASSSTRIFHAGPFETSCGFVRSLSSGPATTQDTHALSIVMEGLDLTDLESSIPGATVSSTATPGETLWTAESTWTTLNGFRPLNGSTGVGHQVGSGDGINRMGVRRYTVTNWNEGVTLATQVDSSCVVLATVTGAIYGTNGTPEFASDFAIAPQSVRAWLESLGKLPAISVTYLGRTRTYVPSLESFSDPSGTPPVIAEWGLLYEPEPGT